MKVFISLLIMSVSSFSLAKDVSVFTHQIKTYEDTFTLKMSETDFYVPKPISDFNVFDATDVGYVTRHWCSYSQARVATALNSSTPVNLFNTPHDAYDPFVQSKPGLRNETIYTQSLLQRLPLFESDESTEPVDHTLACKMKSRESVINYFNAWENSFEQIHCSDLNRMAFDWVNRMLDLRGINKLGRYQFIFEDDIHHLTGSSWAPSKLRLTMDENNTIRVVSTQLYTVDKWFIPSALRGNKYCKLVSPGWFFELNNATQ